MTQIFIFYPVAALALLTFSIGFVMAHLRFKAAHRGDINFNYFKLNRGGEVPEYLAKVANNYTNLLEIPLLFYIVILIIYVTQLVDTTYITLAWLYVGLRFVHTFIHTTYNNVIHRLIPFLLSVLILGGLWVKLVIQMMSQ